MASITNTHQISLIVRKYDSYKIFNMQQKKLNKFKKKMNKWDLKTT